MKNFIKGKRMKNINSKKSLIIFAASIALLLGLQALLSQGDAKGESEGEWQGIDVFIPRGFRLVPIEIDNLKSVKELISGYAFIDLLKVQNKKPVLNGVRLLQSRYNENVFAVLVPEDKVQMLLGEGETFFVVVRGRNEQGQENKTITSRKIIWEE
jgi:hypothetical protein